MSGGERLRLLLRLARIIAADLTIEEMLDRAADAIHELLGFPNVDLPLVDPHDPGVLVIRARGGAYKQRIRHEDRLPVDRGVMGAAVTRGRTQKVDDVSADPRYVQPPSGLSVRAELAVPICHAGRVLGVLNVEGPEPFSDDDVELLEAIADLLAVALEKARRVEGELRVAVLEERQRLARELHDSVTQLLFSATLTGESLPAVARRDPAEAERRRERMVELVRQALAEMRALLKELAPAAATDFSSREFPPASITRLHREGLLALLHSELEGLAAGGIATRLDGAGYERQSREREEVLLRVAQEALANVAKHSDATSVQVRVECREHEVVLRVTDDGRGFDPAAAAREAGRPERGGRGLGLFTMRERIRGLVGRFRVESVPGTGTTVEVALPR